MKLFGTLSELVAAVFRSNGNTVTLNPPASPSGARTLSLPDSGGTGSTELVDVSTTQTLSSKTLGSSNTATGIKLASFTPDGTHTLTAPTATDTLVGQATADTLTNKTLTAPVLSSYADFTEISTPAAPSSGKVRLYSKSGDSLFVQNSAGTETQVGSGSGEKNYLQAGTSTATGWTASGAGITVTTDTTGSELPRPNTTQTGIKVTGVSGSTAYAYYRFILDDADANKKLKVQFDLKPVSGYASNDFQVSVYSNTANDYTTGNTRLALSTDVSSVTGIPNLTGTFRTTFDAPAVSAKYIEVRIGLNGTNTHSCVFSDLIVGPGIVTQGAAITQPFSLSLTPSAGFGTVANTFYEARRVGNYLVVEGRFQNGTVAASTASIALPSGYTIDSTALSTNATGQAVGTYDLIGASTNTSNYPTAGFEGLLFFDGSDTANLYFAYQTGSNAYQKMNGSTFSSTSQHIVFRFTIPIAQWAGAGTVNVVQNDVEYASNSSTATSGGDTTSFAYGPSGSPLPVFTGNSPRRVQFQTPIQATDQLTLEIQTTASGPWTPISAADAGSGAGPLSFQNTAAYGAGFRLDSGFTGANFVTAYFAQYAYPSGATYGAAGTNWPSGARWRVKKASGGQSVGFSIVQPGVSAGLVSASGLPGNASPVSTTSTPAASFVGEYKENVVTGNTSCTSGTIGDVEGASPTGITLTAGVWDLQGAIYLSPAGTTTITAVSGWLGTATGNVTTGRDLQRNYATLCFGSSASNGGNIITLVTPTYRVALSGSQTYYLKQVCTFGTSTMTCNGIIRATRVA